MNVSSLLIRIIFLIVPGIITSRLYRKFKGPRGQKDWEYFFEISVFSIVDYSVYWAFVEGLNSTGCFKFNVTVFQAFFDEKIPISWDEIIVASLIGIFVAFVAGFVYRRKLVNKIARKVGATTRYGDEDVWDFLFNSDEVQWIFVRDHKLDLVYFGRVLAYSDTEKEREILLQEVSVYENPTGAHLYDTPALYVSRDQHDLSIEVQKADNEAQEKN